MTKKLLLLFLLTFSFITNGQIDCKPTLGFGFKPIKKGISLYQKPNLNSKIILKSPEPDNVWLNCTDTNIINDFVEVEVDFLKGAFNDNGVNNLLYWLHHYLTEDYNYRFDFKTFMEFITIKENQQKVYNLLIKDETNDWFKDYSSSDIYDVSTFDGFYKNWIYYDKSKSNDEYIINNQGTKVYVHKNDITSEGAASFVLNGASSGYYLEQLQKQLKLKRENSCIYKEQSLIFYFEYYANALIKEEKPFKVIQQISKYSSEFNKLTSHYTLDFLKMKASYFDKNFITSTEIAKKLVNLFDQKKISNSNKSFNGNLDMSRVYAFLISGLLQTDKYQDALKYSKKCELDYKLQFEQHIEFYAIALLNLNQKTEACRILNQAYLDGNESARELLKKNCE